MFKDTDNGKTCFNRCGDCEHSDNFTQDRLARWCKFLKCWTYINRDTSECKGFKPKEA
jgi:hypothetical protein